MVNLNIWFLFLLSVVLALLVGGCVILWRRNRRLRRLGDRMQRRSRRLEDQLQQAQRYEAVGIMAGSIVHNLNNLMSVILGHTRMVSHDLSEGHEAQQDLRQVLKAGNMAADLLGEIGDFSRQAEQALKPTDLTVPLRDTLKFLRDIAPSSISIREDLPSTAEPVLLSSTSLQQILMNLVGNSLQAIGKQNGLIEVVLRDSLIQHAHPAVPRELEPGNYLRLTVRDNGPGLDRETLQGIKGAYKVQPPDSTHLGLGLNTVFRILDDLQGAAVAHSIPGKGTSFDIYFPKIAWKVEGNGTTRAARPARAGDGIVSHGGLAVVNGQGRREEPATRPTPVSPGEELGTILLVDDEEMVAKVTTLGLQRQGYRVIKHLDSRKALADFTQTPQLFDAVITDQIMPHMSGVRLARKIHSIRPEVPVILMTGVRDSFNDQQTLEAGIAQIVLKPFSHRDLADVIERVRLKRHEGRG